MRINKYVAQATGISRRSVDNLIKARKITVNGIIAEPGQQVTDNDTIVLADKLVRLKQVITIALNKPVGYVCSRNGQGSKTIYDLLPDHYHHLKPVGRLDKDSSGLILLTNDGELANKLTHPSFKKTKVYEITLNKVLRNNDKTIIEQGVQLEDGPSSLQLQGSGKEWTVTMREGRNRQIRRTFTALGYSVIRLHRIQFGSYLIGSIKSGQYI